MSSCSVLTAIHNLTFYFILQNKVYIRHDSRTIAQLNQYTHKSIKHTHVYKCTCKELTLVLFNYGVSLTFITKLSTPCTTYLSSIFGWFSELMDCMCLFLKIGYRSCVRVSSVVWHCLLQLMNSFNKPEAAIFLIQIMLTENLFLRLLHTSIQVLLNHAVTLFHSSNY